MKLHWILISLLALAACSQPEQGTLPEQIDSTQMTVYYSGNILTMDMNQPSGEAIAIRGEFIKAIGYDEQILALGDDSANYIDLNGHTLMPGFVDAHTHILNDHLSQGMSLDRAQVIALKNGITTLGTLYVDRGFMNEIRDFNSKGYLRVRTSLYLIATDPCGNEEGDWWKEFSPTHNAGEMLRIGGVKIFTDGGACGKVALSFELEPGWSTGDLWFTQEKLNDLVSEVHIAGYQAAIHAIGDRAVVQALNAIELALDGQPNTLRHRMEHVSVIPEDQIARFGELGVVPVLIGEFPNCTPYGPPVPEQYGHMEWPWRALREINPDLALAWHSDVPFQSNNPFDHLLGFVTRIDLLGNVVCPPAEWLVESTLTVEEALSIMTIQSAYALFREEEVGSLAPGKFADFIVLSKNPLNAQSEKLAENRVLLTVVGGRVEYCLPPSTDLCPGFYNRNPILLPDLRPPAFVQWTAAITLLALPLGAILVRKKYAQTLRNLGGIAGIAAGISWLSIFLFQEQLSDGISGFLYLSITALFMSFGSLGLTILITNSRFARFGMWLSLIGAITLSEAGIAVAWFQNSSGWGMIMLGILVHSAGWVLFGIANHRAQFFTSWNFFPLVFGPFSGLVPLALGLSVEEFSDVPVFVFMIIISMGIGWAFLGWMTLQNKDSKG